MSLIMKKIELTKALCICICFCIVVLSGCKKEFSSLKDEPLKNITGSWKIVKLTRNGEDMTNRIDLSKFRIVFNEDGTYTIQDKMAFVVSRPGTFSLDDPQYPFYLNFTPQNGADEQQVKFELPITEGKRQISLTISPGCSSNTYQYVFEKAQ